MKTEINNSKLYVTIDSLGAEVKGLRDLHGMEYIWPGDDTYWSGSSPVLFPIVGALRNHTYTYGGKQYTMRQHGFARKMEFKKVSGRTDAVTFCLCANEETKKQYPFDFALYISYALHDESMTVKFRVENRGGEAMPFTIGAHPAFRIPMEEGEALTDYRVKFSQKETASCAAVTKDCLIDAEVRTPFLCEQDSFVLNHEQFSVDALVFDELKSRSVEMYSTVTGRGVRMDFDGFDYFGIWQPYKEGVPFVCLEPWTGTGTLTNEGDRLEDKRGMKLLPPGDAYEIQYTVTIL
ncbi:MAG: aldose 1-epimerase family protein [Clostridia bacterium]|nr:aldose 1-epimerase family protein [Clostridia bacterium]